jgi:hypothetical protein
VGITWRAFLFGVVVVLGAGGLALVDGCTDGCVLSGRACNITSDCDGGEVCRVPGRREVGCFVVRGTCGPGACGSDAECSLSCCNLDTYTCGQRRDRCEGDPACATDDDCSFRQECKGGTCRANCDDDTDCPGSERCRIGVCTAPIGVPCDPTIFGDCFGDDCLDTDTNNRQVAPYCTATCGFTSEGNKTDCPPGFACVDRRCRLQP